MVHDLQQVDKVTGYEYFSFLLLNKWHYLIVVLSLFAVSHIHLHISFVTSGSSAYS